MKKRILYQTLEDRGNNAMVEANGPGYCSDKRAWLCEGYYFWEAGIETAKWWGTRTYANSQRQKGYIVCQTSYDYGADNFFDLAGDSSHRQDFSDRPIQGGWQLSVLPQMDKHKQVSFF